MKKLVLVLVVLVSILLVKYLQAAPEDTLLLVTAVMSAMVAAAVRLDIVVLAVLVEFEPLMELLVLVAVVAVAVVVLLMLMVAVVVV
jgi:hypothetical protein